MTRQQCELIRFDSDFKGQKRPMTNKPHKLCRLWRAGGPTSWCSGCRTTRPSASGRSWRRRAAPRWWTQSSSPSPAPSGASSPGSCSAKSSPRWAFILTSKSQTASVCFSVVPFTCLDQALISSHIIVVVILVVKDYFLLTFNTSDTYNLALASLHLPIANT